MAGLFLDDCRVQTSIQNWINTIISPNGRWEGNNLHIDEIDSLEEITRSEWIDVSFMILDNLMNQYMSINSLMLFLHIDLEFSLEKISIDKLSLNWVKENVCEFTPPSLNITSLEYYSDFYEKNLVNISPDNSLLELVHCSPELYFYYRTYFDEDEKKYSRELYIFVKKNECH